jgi:predicted permease
MSWLDGFKHRVRTVLRPDAHARDVDDEMRFHIEMDVENAGEAGAPRRFGSRTYYREEVRRRTWIGFVDVLRQDLAYAWRTTRRSPGFTGVVVLTLALGIGLNAATFSILDRFYLRPPAGIADPSTVRRMWVEHTRTASGEPFKGQSVSYSTFDAIATATGARDDMALFATDYAMRLGPRPTDPRAAVVFASANYFKVLGVRLALGRFYTNEEDQLGTKGGVAVISHAFWKNRLGGDSSALGRLIHIGPDPFTIVGIADGQFTGLDLRAAEVWLPMGSITPGWGGPRWWTNDNVNPFNVIRRATPGLDDAEFDRRATAIVVELNRQKGTYGDTLQTVWSGPVLEARGPVKQGQDMIISTRLGGVALIVLLIAGANVVNLLLARASQRRREIAVRLALGVSRQRLVRMLTTETLFLAVIAGAGAFFAGWWGASTLRSLLMPGIPWSEPAVDGRVLLFTIAVTVLAGVVAGVIPAIQSSNPRLSSALKAGARDGVRHRSRLRNALVITQAALSVVLLVGAALFVRSLHNVQGLDIGFDSDRLLFGRVAFADGEKPPRPVFLSQMRELAARLRGRPGIEAVARASMEPMQGFSTYDFFVGADSAVSFGRRSPLSFVVSPSFFGAVGLRMLRGRGFSGDDDESGPMELVVNDAMAKLVWPGRDPLGQCVRLEKRDSPCYTVVGVVETARLSSVIEREESALFYVPLGSQPTPNEFGGQLVIRAKADFSLTAASELRAMLKRTFPRAEPIVAPMTENLEPEYRPWRLGATLFTGVGLLALLVAMLGIYSTVSYGVTQRTHEFGVRVALGARARDLVRQVVGEGMRTVAVGIGLGVALALAAGKLIEALLYGIAPRNPVVLTLVSASLLSVAILATLVPAWRAARADPISALRAD